MGIFTKLTEDENTLFLLPNWEQTFVDWIIVWDAWTEWTGININGVTFDSTFKVSDINGTNYAQTILHRHSTTLEPLIVWARSNSNTLSHTAVTAWQWLFSVYATWTAWTNYKIFWQEQFAVDDTGTISSTSAPWKWTLLLTPDWSLTPTAVITARNDKSVTFSWDLSVATRAILAWWFRITWTPDVTGWLWGWLEWAYDSWNAVTKMRAYDRWAWSYLSFWINDWVIISSWGATTSMSIWKIGNAVASACLELTSTTKGFLPPVMTTTQKNAIASPAILLVVWDSTLANLDYYNWSAWVWWFMDLTRSQTIWWTKTFTWNIISNASTTTWVWENLIIKTTSYGWLSFYKNTTRKAYQWFDADDANYILRNEATNWDIRIYTNWTWKIDIAWKLRVTWLPTSSAWLSAWDVWSNSWILTIV
jgi:hypothetical protein